MKLSAGHSLLARALVKVAKSDGSPIFSTGDGRQLARGGPMNAATRAEYEAARRVIEAREALRNSPFSMETGRDGAGNVPLRDRKSLAGLVNHPRMKGRGQDTRARLWAEFDLPMGHVVQRNARDNATPVERSSPQQGPADRRQSPPAGRREGATRGGRRFYERETLDGTGPKPAARPDLSELEASKPAPKPRPSGFRAAAEQAMDRTHTIAADDSIWRKALKGLRKGVGKTVRNPVGGALLAASALYGANKVDDRYFDD